MFFLFTCGVGPHAVCVGDGFFFHFPPPFFLSSGGEGGGGIFPPSCHYLGSLTLSLTAPPPPPPPPVCGVERGGGRGSGGLGGGVGAVGSGWRHTHTHTHPPISLWRQIPLSPPQPAVSHAGIGRRAEVAARTSHAAAPPSVRVLPLPSCRRCRCRRHQTPRSDDIRRRVSLWRRRL